MTRDATSICRYHLHRQQQDPTLALEHSIQTQTDRRDPHPFRPMSKYTYPLGYAPIMINPVDGKCSTALLKSFRSVTRASPVNV